MKTRVCGLFSRIRLSKVSLGAKFLLSIGPVIGLSMGAIFYWTSQKQEEYILQQVEKQSRTLVRKTLQGIRSSDNLRSHGGEAERTPFR